jgi:hypothetical protein
VCRFPDVGTHQRVDHRGDSDGRPSPDSGGRPRRPYPSIQGGPGRSRSTAVDRRRSVALYGRRPTPAPAGRSGRPTRSNRSVQQPAATPGAAHRCPGRPAEFRFRQRREILRGFLLPGLGVPVQPGLVRPVRNPSESPAAGEAVRASANRRTCFVVTGRFSPSHSVNVRTWCRGATTGARPRPTPTPGTAAPSGAGAVPPSSRSSYEVESSRSSSSHQGWCGRKP